MATITFRTDAEVDRALADMGAEGERSQVIRDAILAAWRRQRDEEIRVQALEVANDPEDLAEARAIRQEMESLRAW